MNKIWFAPPHLQWLRGSRVHHNNRLHLLCSTLECREIQPIRRKNYDTTDLYQSEGRYGSWNITAFAILAIATFLGWELVVNSSASWLNWQGYLLCPIGGKDGTWAATNMGVTQPRLSDFSERCSFRRAISVVRKASTEIVRGTEGCAPYSTTGKKIIMINDDEWLVVIDRQEAFAHNEWSRWACSDGAYYQTDKNYIRLAKAYGDRVAYTRYIAPQPPKGVWVEYMNEWPEFQVPSDDPMNDLTPETAELAKGHPIASLNSFGKWGPELQAAIKGSQKIVLCGVAIDACVLQTALAAADQGIAV